MRMDDFVALIKSHRRRWNEAITKSKMWISRSVTNMSRTTYSAGARHFARWTEFSESMKSTESMEENVGKSRYFV